MIDFRVFLRSSLDTAWLILKLIIPLYILAEILFYFDVLKYFNFLFEPIAQLLNLPVEATLAIMAGMVFNLYAAIAFAAPLDLSAYDWTVLGLFLGICHSLLIETAVIKKIGVGMIYNISIRLFTGLAAATCLRFLPDNWFNGQRIGGTDAIQTFNNFPEMLLHALKKSLILSAEVIVLVLAILFVLELIKQSKWLKHKQEKVSMSFSILIGVVLGITYGAGVLINESKSGKLSKRDLLYISTFLIICHAIIEDTLLFVIFGANMWVMVVIRMVLALVISYVAILVLKPEPHPKAQNP